ncbi:hypothetical protein J6590_004021 [Homalodisca vitripennis]|nr:hypothetical protein J6590_004021 [Homalodisca vitripennis]
MDALARGSTYGSEESTTVCPRAFLREISALGIATTTITAANQQNCNKGNGKISREVTARVIDRFSHVHRSPAAASSVRLAQISREDSKPGSSIASRTSTGLPPQRRPQISREDSKPGSSIASRTSTGLPPQRRVVRQARVTLRITVRSFRNAHYFRFINNDKVFIAHLSTS